MRCQHHTGELTNVGGQDFDKGPAHPYNWNMKVREENMPQPQEKPTKEQLKLLALKQRIGEITSDYEDKIADIRAYVTQLQEHYEEIFKNNESEMEALQAQLRTYQDATVEAEVPADPQD